MSTVREELIKKSWSVIQKIDYEFIRNLSE